MRDASCILCCERFFRAGFVLSSVCPCCIHQGAEICRKKLSCPLCLWCEKRNDRPLQCASSPSPCVGSGGPVFRHVTCSTCCETFSESFKDAEVAQLLDALREAGWSGWWLPKLQIAICFLYLFALLHIPFFAVGDWGWRHQLAIDGKTTRSQRSSTLKGWSWVCRWNGDWEC